MRIVSADQAVGLIEDGDTLLIGGSGGGHAVPERLIVALEQRFLANGGPRDITSLHPVGLGDEAAQGVSRFAHRGLLRRVICGTLVDSPPLAQLALDNGVEAYTLPQGALSQLMREMAAGRPGLITKVGLHTFVDPRIDGGRQNTITKDDVVKLVTLDGEEWLHYQPFTVDVAFLRGTTADEDGNVTMEHEAVFGEMLSMAQATRRSGGVVIVQVERISKRGTLNAKQVKIPGILVDLVVVDSSARQTYETPFDPAYAGELKVPTSSLGHMPLGPQKVILRRAAMELFPGAICNLGSGIMTGLSQVAAEEGFIDDITLTNEQGLIGGAPASGNDAGAAKNYAAMIDQPYQFDFYDGGGLDLAFLSFAQVAPDGSVNISRFADRLIGIGGFVNISQNAKKVIFGGYFSAGGLRADCSQGQLVISREGEHPKFVDELQQITYSGPYGRSRNQDVLFITERAVFSLGPRGVRLIEIAPGLDVMTDVIKRMAFVPEVADPMTVMDTALFLDSPIGLRDRIQQKPRVLRAKRLAKLK